MKEIQAPCGGTAPGPQGVAESGLWGIIYCPKEGKRKRWSRIKRYLYEQGVQFDFVQSEGPGSVERLAAMMTRSGYRTIIVVGGDAALNHALGGIMRTPAPDGGHPALGVIPNGNGNDFARYWGFDEKDYKRTVDRLMMRRTRRIDVGVLRDLNAGRPGTAQGTPVEEFFLNCVNIGAVASIIRLRRSSLHFWGISSLAYLTSAFLLLFRRLSFSLDFSLNGERHRQRAMNLSIGSAPGYGMTPGAVPYNGLLDLSLVSTPPLTQLFHGLWLHFTSHFLRHRDIQVWRTRGIRFDSIGNAPVSLDGRALHHELHAFQVDILPEELEFLIP